MIGTIGGRLLGATVRLADTLHLRWVLSGIVRRLPPPLRLRLGKAQVRLGYMEGLTLVPEENLESACAAALELLGGAVSSPGAAYLEFGVYVGTSMACMYRAAARKGADGLRLIGFDSFQGMPKSVEEQDDQRWHEGELYSDVELTKTNLRRLGVPLERVELVPGWFEESLTDETRRRIGIASAPIVMVDCVLSSATRVALDFLTALITDRTVIFFDDWAAHDLADRGIGERVAFEEWLSAHPELKAEKLPSLSYSHDSRAFLVSRVAGAQH
jgi:O-methyltransferase